MKKLKKLFAGAILMSTMLALGACGDGYKEFDLNKCEEVALQYLEEKYGEKFEVTDCWEAKKYIGSAGYVKVEVKKEESDNDNTYLLVVYPKEDKDENHDGYYDLYEVTSDDYMSGLINDVIRKKMDELLIGEDFPEFYSTMWMEAWDERNYTAGITSNFEESDAYSYSIKELFEKYQIYMVYTIRVSEGNYNDKLQNQMSEALKSKISDDFISCKIYTYSEKNYDEKETKNEQDAHVRAQIEKKVEFIVEDRDEFIK